MGVCKVLPEGGLLYGLLSPRFIFIFLACLFKLCVQIFFAVANPTTTPDGTLLKPFSTPTAHYTFGTLAMYLPGLITGVISTWHCGLFKTFLTHPSLLLLPTFSYFTFESNTLKCSAKREPLNDVEIRFSVKWTYLNIFLSQIAQNAI